MKSKFVPLDSRNIESVERLMKKRPSVKKVLTPKSRIHFRLRDNFTIAVLRTNGDIHIGVAKRNPIDKDNLDIGKKVALWRAAESEPI